ncbi:MAG: sulfite oxidase-like oxidoreductase [Dehalococcoidia bacterium]|nr:sulfite oxidase-like oxidoreductase [Dehalococcoidia bacterium]MQG16062.1 sulfite oxidase-like oxidoreductase [SAR202 cluster bacterium]|tara:strand:+ start:119443 stop:120048 length:606 start_codon:yes stop_codon:yes gene_type:complete
MKSKLGKLKTRIFSKSDEHEAPPGQFVTDKFPVLTFGTAPNIVLDQWNITLFGSVKENVHLNWNEIMHLKRICIQAEFHCVTQWSKLLNKWEGVGFSSLMDLVEIRKEVQYVMIHCYGGYSTNLPLDVLLDDDVILAYRHDGSDLSLDHGGPLRLVVPKRYGWKSAKWINGIEFMEENQPGFWESRGYHMEGDPWKEQRFK